jgi:hypothetical protein
MTYAIPAGSNIRGRLTRWSSPLLFSITFCALLSHQFALSGLTQNQVMDSKDLQHIDERVLVLEKSAAVASSEQSGVSYSDLNALNDSFNERITELATAMTAVASQAELQALEQQVQKIEKNRVQVLTAPASTKPHKPRSKPRIVVEFPLQILGQEIRGGEHFLSVGAIGAESLDQCQLIRVGETYMGWKLDGVEGQSAVFTANGATRRLNIR